MAAPHLYRRLQWAERRKMGEMLLSTILVSLSQRLHRLNRRARLLLKYAITEELLLMLRQY